MNYVSDYEIDCLILDCVDTDTMDRWLKQWMLKATIRARLANPVDTIGHANLETYIWACQNDCINGWNFKTQRYEGTIRFRYHPEGP